MQIKVGSQSVHRSFYCRLTVQISHDCEWRTATVCLDPGLDKVVYFTLEQTLTNWTVHYAFKGIALTEHVNENKNSDAEIILVI